MSASRESGLTETIYRTEQSLEETLAMNEGLVLVDFWASWCGPCRAIAPIIEELVQESAGRVTLVKVNVDEQPDLAARYEIRSIPTLVFFKHGAIIDRIIGAVPKAVLQAVVDAHA